MLEQENPDLDHEWLQLIQLEKAIDEQKKLLLATEIGDHGDPDGDNEPFGEAGGNFVKRSDHLDDEDLGYVNNILNSFSKPIGNHEGTSHFKLRSITPDDVPARACASQMTPPEFNLKFNQKSTTRGTEEDHFSYSSNVEDERAIELGDYFSDDEEDDTGDRQDLKSESIFWSPTKFNNSEEKSPLSHTALSELNPVISGLETFEDHREAKLNHISGFLEETQLGFSTWQPFIPLEHVFQNSAAQSQPSDFSSQASSSQEPTRIPISTIATSTKLTLLPIIIKRVSWFKSSLLLRIQSDSFTNINS
jgi:hypothetical protein